MSWLCTTPTRRLIDRVWFYTPRFWALSTILYKSSTICVAVSWMSKSILFAYITRISTILSVYSSTWCSPFKFLNSFAELQTCFHCSEKGVEGIVVRHILGYGGLRPLVGNNCLFQVHYLVWVISIFWGCLWGRLLMLVTGLVRAKIVSVKLSLGINFWNEKQFKIDRIFSSRVSLL